MRPGEVKHHRSEFLKVLKAEFPGVREAINAEGGLLHFEMDAFRKYVQRAISQRNEEVVLRAFGLALQTYRVGDAKLKDAVDVSFVEPMDFCPWAWELLPEDLKDLYVQFHGKSGA